MRWMRKFLLTGHLKWWHSHPQTYEQKCGLRDFQDFISRSYIMRPGRVRSKMLHSQESSWHVWSAEGNSFHARKKAQPNQRTQPAEIRQEVGWSNRQYDVRCVGCQIKHGDIPQLSMGFLARPKILYTDFFLRLTYGLIFTVLVSVGRYELHGCYKGFRYFEIPNIRVVHIYIQHIAYIFFAGSLKRLQEKWP